MTKIQVTNDEILTELYDDSALTFIGQYDEDENLKAIFNWIKDYTPLKHETVYIIKGVLMNNVYGLTGTNAYCDDLTILCFKLSDMENPLKLAIPRLEVGGRWFDDVVDNNARH